MVAEGAVGVCRMDPDRKNAGRRQRTGHGEGPSRTFHARSKGVVAEVGEEGVEGGHGADNSHGAAGVVGESEDGGVGEVDSDVEEEENSPPLCRFWTGYCETEKQRPFGPPI